MKQDTVRNHPAVSTHVWIGNLQKSHKATEPRSRQEIRQAERMF